MTARDGGLDRETVDLELLLELSHLDASRRVVDPQESPSAVGSRRVPLHRASRSPCRPVRPRRELTTARRTLALAG